MYIVLATTLSNSYDSYKPLLLLYNYAVAKLRKSLNTTDAIGHDLGVAIS